LSGSPTRVFHRIHPSMRTEVWFIDFSSITFMNSSLVGFFEDPPDDSFLFSIIPKNINLDCLCGIKLTYAQLQLFNNEEDCRFAEVESSPESSAFSFGMLVGSMRACQSVHVVTSPEAASKFQQFVSLAAKGIQLHLHTEQELVIALPPSNSRCIETFMDEEEDTRIVIDRVLTWLGNNINNRENLPKTEAALQNAIKQRFCMVKHVPDPTAIVKHLQQVTPENFCVVCKRSLKGPLEDYPEFGSYDQSVETQIIKKVNKWMQDRPTDIPTKFDHWIGLFGCIGYLKMEVDPKKVIEKLCSQGVLQIKAADVTYCLWDAV